MMINKRLIGTVRGSRSYVAGNVALQWCALAANIAMIGAVCRLLNRLYLETAGTEDLLFTAAMALAAVIVLLVRRGAKRKKGKKPPFETGNPGTPEG